MPLASVCAVLTSLVLLYACRQSLVADAVSGSFLSSLEVARAALHSHNPHVVVGFSWGGALTCDLVNSNHWSGPTVLLAPAHRKLLELRGLASPSQPPPSVRLPNGTVVVHSRADTLVPVEHSRELTRFDNNPASATANNNPAVRLLEIDKDPHKMWSLATDGTLARLVHQAGFEAAAARDKAPPQSRNGAPAEE